MVKGEDKASEKRRGSTSRKYKHREIDTYSIMLSTLSNSYTSICVEASDYP